MGDIDRYVEDDTGHRYYDDGAQREPSVTTILGIRNEDTSGLENWRDKNDGEGDSFYHGHHFWYTRNRGTLAHWHALSQLDEDLPWSDDEAESRHELFYQEDPRGDLDGASPREVLYSVLKAQDAVATWGDFYEMHSPYKGGDYYREELLAHAERDIRYFKETFNRLCDDLGINERNVIAVEEFLVNHQYHFAGQIDLLLEYDGDVVAADLKTSSSNRDKNKMQLAAYSTAVELDDDIPVDEVDRTEVWRIHPDSGTYSIHANDEVTDLHDDSYWRETKDESWTEFKDLADQFWNNHYTEYRDET